MYTLRIVDDMNPSSPRDWDNLGIIAASHRRYNLADKDAIDLNDFDGWNDVEKHLNEQRAVFLPVYMYEHSAVALKTSPFGDAWDSGQVGFIYCPVERMIKEYGNDSEETREKVTEYLKGKIKTYSQYLNGEVYGYIVEDEDGEHVTSCYGFFDRGHAEEEGNAELAHYESLEMPSIAVKIFIDESRATDELVIKKKDLAELTAILARNGHGLRSSND